MNDTKAFTLITNARVLVPERRDTPLADILIEGDEIAEIGGTLSAPDTATVIDGTDRLVIPGLINAHTHGHGALHKGAADRWTLELLINAGPWISANRSTEHKYLSALIAAAEMLLKGCTAAYDLYVEIPVPTVEGVTAVGSAYRDAGMRAVVAPMLADRSFFEAIPDLVDAMPAGLKEKTARITMAPLSESMATARNLLTQWSLDREWVRPAIAPTIPLHCSDEYLLASQQLAAEFDVGLHTHLAESKIQALAGIKRYGKTLTAHLDEIGFLGPNFTAAHAVWLDGDDIKRMADNGASVAHNPGSNMRLGSGIAAVREMLDTGVNVGVGTDGAHCSDNQNMFEAMRLGSFVSRVRSHDYDRWVGTDDAFRMTTEGSARALGLGDKIGKLAPGYKADLVLLDLGHVNWIPLSDVTNQLVHTEDGNAVDRVMVGGHTVVEQGRLINVDIAKLKRDAEAAMSVLAPLNRESRAFAEQLERHVGKFCIGLARSPYHVHAMAGEAH